MKVVDLHNPVMSDWMIEQGLRLDPGPYLSGLFGFRKLLERLPNKVRLDSVTTGHNGGIYHGPKFRRVYVQDEQHGVPFFSTKDMMRIDFTGLPLLKKSDALSRGLSYLRVRPGMTLISCSGFNAGRRAYVRPDMDGFWSSQDVIKVNPDRNSVPPGYLYAFLFSPYGESLIRGSVYGSAVKHIEPHHISGIPVPRFDAVLEERINGMIEESAELRTAFQASLVSATEDFFKSVGLPDFADYHWHSEGRDLGFEVGRLGPTSLRALNFAPRAIRLINRLKSVHHMSLGRICAQGELSRGVRFKRIDSDPGHGIQLLGQRQVFWLRPEGRWVSATATPPEVFAANETVLVAARGTLGENEVYGRSALVTGNWLKYAYSEDFLRVVSGDSEIPGSYLFAFLRSEVAFRILRSVSSGGKQQDVHEGLRAEIPVPIAAPADRERIAETVRQAYRDRDRADALEGEALALLTNAVEEASALWVPGSSLLERPSTTLSGM